MSTQSLAEGRYLLESVVGTGGMAEVYRARDARLGREVAVKLFRPGAADGVSRGSDEARLLAGLHHPGLVRILDMDSAETSAGPTYLVMELIEGPDLGAVLADGPLAAETVRLIGWDVARTLAYIHQRGILHRDIKPSNILTRVTEPDSGVFGYLLTDFGIARFYDGARQTATGQTIGTAAYLSPEQARGGEIDTPTDLYSLGLVLLECLTGKRAFPGTSLETAVARLHRAPEIPEALGPNWQSLLTRMTADNPADRPTAGAVAAELAQWRTGEQDSHQQTSYLPNVHPQTEVLTPDRPAATRFQLSLPDEPVNEPAQTTVIPAAARRPASPPANGSVHHSAAGPAAAGRPGAAPSSAGRRPEQRGRRRRRWVLGVLAVVAVVVLVGIAVVGLNLGGDAIEDLPSVPGTTGELLQELYERVQP